MTEIKKIINDLLQKVKAENPGVNKEVIEEIDGVLQTTLASRDIRTAEMVSIANKLIKFQTEKEAGEKSKNEI